MKALLARITAHRTRTDQITFREDRGQVCTAACRSAAHVSRVTTAAYRARF
ncbi:hypothetical protein ABZ806_23425 [Spirillospora sp. NPDC047418]|jgi:hypothetical protein